MHGQFFILSIVIISMALGGIVLALHENRVPLYEPVADDIPFRLHNLRSEAEQSFELAASEASSTGDFSLIGRRMNSFASFAENEFRKDRISLDMKTTVSGSLASPKASVSLTLRDEQTVVSDSFALF